MATGTAPTASCGIRATCAGCRRRRTRSSGPRTTTSARWSCIRASSPYGNVECAISCACEVSLESVNFRLQRDRARRIRRSGLSIRPSTHMAVTESRAADRAEVRRGPGAIARLARRANSAGWWRPALLVGGRAVSGLPGQVAQGSHEVGQGLAAKTPAESERSGRARRTAAGAAIHSRSPRARRRRRAESTTSRAASRNVGANRASGAADRRAVPPVEAAVRGAAPGAVPARLLPLDRHLFFAAFLAGAPVVERARIPRRPDLSARAPAADRRRADPDGRACAIRCATTCCSSISRRARRAAACCWRRSACSITSGSSAS